MCTEIAVITGDIMGSQRLSIERWMIVLKRTLSLFGEEGSVWELHRGDAFQLLLSDPLIAFAAGFRIKAELIAGAACNVRLAIGIGKCSYRAVRVGESSGSAFVRSGALLDSLEDRHMTMAVASDWSEWDERTNASLALAAIIIDRWLPNYARASACAMANPELNQAGLANELKLAQSTVSERLSRAHYKALMAYEANVRAQLEVQLTQ